MMLVACAVVFLRVSVSGGGEGDLEGRQSGGGGGGGLPKRTALNAAHSALLTLTTVGYVCRGVVGTGCTAAFCFVGPSNENLILR